MYNLQPDQLPSRFLIVPNPKGVASLTVKGKYQLPIIMTRIMNCPVSQC